MLGLEDPWMIAAYVGCFACVAAAVANWLLCRDVEEEAENDE